MKHILIATIAAAFAVVPATAAGPAMPGWLTGCWSQIEGPNWTEECWSGPRAGNMFGGGRRGRGDTLVGWESLQIEQGADGRITLYTQPQGGQRIPYAMVSAGDREIVFANPAHDYPQRVRYWREGMDLNAEISLSDGSRAMRWHYKRAMR